MITLDLLFETFFLVQELRYFVTAPLKPLAYFFNILI